MPSNNPALLTDTWLSSLQTYGHRITRPLQVLVNLLVHSKCALSPVDLYDLGRREYPRLGLVTVYRTLEKLEELGMIQRVHQPGGCNAYLPRVEGHQHLIICQQCGKAEYFEGGDMNLFFKRVSREHGFTVNEHWLQLFGLCAECQKKL